MVISRNAPRVTQRVVSLPQLFALLLLSIRIGVAFASKNKAKGQPARHKTDRKRDIGFETDKWLDRQTETQLEALKRLCWYCVKVVIRHSDVETDRQSDRQSDRQTVRQTDRQTGRQTVRQTDRQTLWRRLQHIQSN